MTAASSSSSEPPGADPPNSPGDTVLDARGLGVWYRAGHQKQTVRSLLFNRKPAESSRPKLKWALRDVDLRCGSGQTLGIVGHNGAGKSTLCLAIAGILEPDEGTVDVRGRVCPLLGLGTGFNKDLTGRENIRTYAAFLGIKRRDLDALMPGIIEFSELGDAIDQPIRGYSSGMRARLGFSVATAVEPDVLILDEVLAVGDAPFRAKCRARLKEMMQRSRLIVIVSHSVAFLRSTCTHAVWLDQGRVRTQGEASRVLDDYQAWVVSKSPAGEAMEFEDAEDA